MLTTRTLETAPGAVFPHLRLRRLRRTAELRAMVRETHLAPTDFIYPLFVVGGSGVREEITAVPGQFPLSVDGTVKEAEAAFGEGVPSVILFGVPETKDARGTSAADPEGPVAQAVRALKQALPRLVVMTDVCLCQYTEHGHCGVLHGQEVESEQGERSYNRGFLTVPHRKVFAKDRSGKLPMWVDPTWEALSGYLGVTTAPAPVPTPVAA